MLLLRVSGHRPFARVRWLASQVSFKEAHLASYAAIVIRNCKGYIVSVSHPMDPDASEEEMREADVELNKELEQGTRLVAQAYSHFLKGKHPYTRYLSLLLPETAFSSDAEAWKTIGVSVNEIAIELLVKPGLPDAVRSKVFFDFMWAQAFPGGVVHESGIVRIDSRGPKYVGSVLANGLNNLETVAFAFKYQAEIQALIEIQSSAQMEPGAKRIAGETLVLMKAIILFLQGKDLSNDLIEAALQVPPGLRDNLLMKLIWMSTGRDISQLSRLIDAVKTGKRWQYEDLLK